ncbi:hypothetical protein IAT38_008106 [Cryptococcus sp. DSM 104549]
MDALEKAALDGSLFAGPSGPPSPTRSLSTASNPNTDDELGSDLELDEPSDDDEAGGLIKFDAGGRVGGGKGAKDKGAPGARVQTQLEHDGPQTGVKGVIEDKKAATSHARSLASSAAAQRAVEQSRRAMVALTVHEEAALRSKDEAGGTGAGDDDLSEWRKKRKEELQRERALSLEGEAAWEKEREGDFGYGGGEKEKGVRRGALREVGGEGFVDAVERVGWVVILIYEPDIPRCNALLASLLHLSLNLPPYLPSPLLLLRARASSLSFSLLPPKSGDVDADGEPLGRPDPDVLPTILAYKDGVLEKTWIRADWDVTEDGVEGLLRREGILPVVHRVGINRQPYNDNEQDDD